MMKMTRKDATNLFGMTVMVGYCDLQYLVNYSMKCGYNKGVYGWNWDCYRIFNSDMTKCVNVVTGYRNMVGYDLPAKMVERYNYDAYMAHKTGGNFVELLDSFVNDVYNHILG